MQLPQNNANVKLAIVHRRSHKRQMDNRYMIDE